MLGCGCREGGDRGIPVCVDDRGHEFALSSLNVIDSCQLELPQPAGSLTLVVAGIDRPPNWFTTAGLCSCLLFFSSSSVRAYIWLE